MEVAAYFIGGPMDLTKKRLASACESFRWPSNEVALEPTAQIAANLKYHHYRRVGMLSDDVVIFIYEGTW